jgi:hypothetical protein
VQTVLPEHISEQNSIAGTFPKQTVQIMHNIGSAPGNPGFLLTQVTTMQHGK